MEKSMGMVYILLQLFNIKETSMIINLIPQDSSNMKKEVSMKEIFKMEKKTGKEFILGQMDHIMKDIIKMIKSMDKVNISQLILSIGKVNGIMVKEKVLEF